MNKLFIILCLLLAGVMMVQPVSARSDVVYRNIPLHKWESLEQFEGWYESKLTHLLPSSSYKVDCDDYAERMQLKALVEGYPLSSHLVINGYILDKKITDEKLHMGNLVMIGNDIYYVEPQPEHFKIVWVCNRD